MKLCLSHKKTIFLCKSFNEKGSKDILRGYKLHVCSQRCNRCGFNILLSVYRSSAPELLLRKRALKICNKFTGEHPCWSVISIELPSNFIEIASQNGCSPVDLLHIFRTLFPKSSLKVVLHGAICMIRFVWLLFGFKVLHTNLKR